MNLPKLCGVKGCRRPTGHKGKHESCPTAAWRFMEEKDKKKLTKAGFATPRGGDKGGYQNHVSRSNRVILPFEKIETVPLGEYSDAYVVRLYPEQYFEQPNCPREAFTTGNYSWVKVGENAFVLYRTHECFDELPPPPGWKLRYLERNGRRVQRRAGNAIDRGHYVLRISRLGARPRRYEGPPQGVFAPEYADQETNFLCKCVLAWLLIHTVDSPYTTRQAGWLRAILGQEGLLDDSVYEYNGVMRHGLTSCPLCLRLIPYQQLHAVVGFEEAIAAENAPDQVEGATRSTIVNLFHLEPLTYDSLSHIPSNIAWGHAVCNTLLGQRRCFSLAELKKMGSKVGIIKPEGVETFGWISDDHRMIRSASGAVWIQLCDDLNDEAVPDAG